ncbi:MAG: hypothetical protein ABWX59_01370 [Microbacteriaceae bacterium]
MVQARVAPFAAGAVCAAVLLVGCASPSPTVPGGSSTPPQTLLPSPSATETPSPDPAVIVIGARELTVHSTEGTVLHELSYSDDPSGAVDVLTDVLGSAPEVRDHPQQECAHARTVAEWGTDSFILVYGPELPLPADLQFQTVAVVDEVAGVRIETPTGSSVGGSVAELIAAVPDAPVEVAEFDGVRYESVHYDIGEDNELGRWGADAGAENGVIRRLGGGQYLSGDC